MLPETSKFCLLSHPMGCNKRYTSWRNFAIMPRSGLDGNKCGFKSLTHWDGKWHRLTYREMLRPAKGGWQDFTLGVRQRSCTGGRYDNKWVQLDGSTCQWGADLWPVRSNLNGNSLKFMTVLLFPLNCDSILNLEPSKLTSCEVRDGNANGSCEETDLSWLSRDGLSSSDFSILWKLSSLDDPGSNTCQRFEINIRRLNQTATVCSQMRTLGLKLKFPCHYLI